MNYYTGRGNHSVFQLESMVDQRNEQLHLKQLKIQELESLLYRVSAMVDAELNEFPMKTCREPTKG